MEHCCVEGIQSSSRDIPVRAKGPFTPEEARKILDAAKRIFPWFYPVVLTAALTGDRRGSLSKVEVGDFHPEQRELHARPENSKKGKGKVHVLPDVLFDVLKDAANGRPKTAPLFTTPKGARLSEKVYDRPDDMEKEIPKCRAWYALQKAAGVRPRGIHNLRRSVVTNLAAANVSMDLITGVTGHTNEVARENYLIVDRKTQLGTARKLAAIYGIEGNARGANARETKAAEKPATDLLPSQAQEPHLSPQGAHLSVQMTRKEAELFLRNSRRRNPSFQQFGHKSRHKFRFRN